jgi:DNA-binding transcriptional ArsR family regulator
MDALKALQAAPAPVRTAALALLDQVSAPLTERQLASAFRAHGIGLLEARRMARALRKLDIIAIARRDP